MQANGEHKVIAALAYLNLRLRSKISAEGILHEDGIRFRVLYMTDGRENHIVTNWILVHTRS
jgi:hypothetical protein